MKRPTVPMWSHAHYCWVFDGEFYEKGELADRKYHLAMCDYADWLEEELIKAGASHLLQDRILRGHEG